MTGRGPLLTDMPYPFTHTTYRSLIRSLRDAGYEPAAFAEAGSMLQAGKSFVLLRHDVDFDVQAAATLAEIDTDEQFPSTFFLLLRTLHYNLFSREASAAVRRILALGHRVGLHFDCANYPSDTSVADLSAACRLEAGILQEWFGVRIDAVSYHRPNPLVLSGDPELSRPYPHTYLPLYTREVHYCSDSRGQWHFGFPLESQAFRETRPLHLLLHPIWWTDTDQPPIDKLRAHLASQARQLEHSMAANCAVYK